MTPKSQHLQGRSDRHVLLVFLNGIRIGNIYQNSSGLLRLLYTEEWRQNDNAYPLSLSLPLTAREHRNEAVRAFLWGLLPDSERTLDHYGRLFSVSPRNPVALLTHMGADCAGAVQFTSPDLAEQVEGVQPIHGIVEWLSAEEVAKELKTVREQGIPGTSRGTIGQFSLAGAQPKIALLEDNGRWGRPSGRIPTNRILKPPSGELHGFAENEHFCLELAAELALGSVASRVMTFAGEVAIVVERFDREHKADSWLRIHQEDVCQALGVMPTRKYENEGGPGVLDVIALLREASTKPEEDVERFLRAIVLNWVLAATDAHAKNYALLHGSRGVRLAPFYDMLSYLPYTDEKLHRVKLAMRIGSDYMVRRVNRGSFTALAKRSRLPESMVLSNVMAVLDALPSAVDRTAQRSLHQGLDSSIVEELRSRVQDRVTRCMETMKQPVDAPTAS